MFQAKKMLLVIYGVCTLIMVKAYLYAGTPERQLEQYKSRNNILHDMLINENCLTALSGRSRQEPAADERTDTQLEVEMRFYEELTTLLLECRQMKQPDTTTPTIITTRGPLINVALGKTIAMRSPEHDGGFRASYVVDGIAADAVAHLSYCNDDSNQTNAFITIDLGQEYTVREIELWKRPETKHSNYTDIVADLEFRVAPTLDGFDNPASLCYFRPGIPTLVRPETFTCPQPIKGRYVRTLRRTRGLICIIEIEVYA